MEEADATAAAERCVGTTKAVAVEAQRAERQNRENFIGGVSNYKQKRKSNPREEF